MVATVEVTEARHDRTEESPAVAGPAFVAQDVVLLLLSTATRHVQFS